LCCRTCHCYRFIGMIGVLREDYVHVEQVGQAVAELKTLGSVKSTGAPVSLWKSFLRRNVGIGSPCERRTTWHCTKGKRDTIWRRRWTTSVKASPIGCLGHVDSRCDLPRWWRPECGGRWRTNNHAASVWGKGQSGSVVWSRCSEECHPFSIGDGEIEIRPSVGFELALVGHERPDFLRAEAKAKQVADNGKIPSTAIL